MAGVNEENLTEVVLKRWGVTPDPRLREVVTSLITHLHAFVRDVEPTGKEWFTAIEFLTKTGKLCSDTRQEFILMSDVLGVSMLVDAINNRRPSGATPSTVEGPFHIPHAPELGDGENMAEGAPGVPCFVTGIVRGLDGQPIANAELDLWQTDGEGVYQDQRPNNDGPYMRGIYHTKADGSYVVRTVAPIAYTIPMDGTIGALVAKTEISHMRPAHIHFAVQAPGYHSLVTHLFEKGDDYIDNDVVYGVKDALIVEFKKRPAGSKAPTGETMNEPFCEVHYDFVLEKQAKAKAAA